MGGSQYQIKCLIDYLVPLGLYDIYYLAKRVPARSAPEGYRIVPISPGGGLSRIGFVMDSPALYRALRKIRPDVIYQRVGCSYTGVAAQYSRRHDARLIWHIAHDFDVTPGAHPGAGNPVTRFLEKRGIEFGIRHARHIVAQTSHQATLLHKHYKRRVDAIVPNFHPLPIDDLDKSGPLTVLWVANLKPWKNPGAFVRLASALGNAVQARFVMLGARSQSSSHESWEETLLSDIRAVPNLDYLGWKSQEEVNRWMGRAHLFVNTSLDEGFANTFIQAWMRRVPVISLHVDPDGILESEGIGAHAGSEDRLAQIVRNLLCDPGEREKFASRAEQYATRTHSFSNAKLLQQLIDSGRVEAPDQSGGTYPAAMSSNTKLANR